jgi:hypothetical protein
MRKGISAFLTILFFGCGIVSHTSSFAIVQPHRVSRSEVLAMTQGRDTPMAYGLAYTSHTILVADTISLATWFVKSRTPARGTIVWIHGIGSCKESFLGTVAIMGTLGFNSIMLDLRAHGQSDGRFCTYGFYEKHDIMRVLDSLLALYPDSGPIGVFGSSLGAAISLQVMAMDSRIECGVFESGFADLRTTVHRYFDKRLRIISDATIDDALGKSSQMASLYPDSVRPAESAKRITDRKVLIVHGEKDEHIPITDGERIFSNLSTPFKKWLVIKSAGHYDMQVAGGEEYQRQIIRFFEESFSD